MNTLEYRSLPRSKKIRLPNDSDLAGELNLTIDYFSDKPNNNNNNNNKKPYIIALLDTLYELVDNSPYYKSILIQDLKDHNLI
jgi:hypothetical protein